MSRLLIKNVHLVTPTGLLEYAWLYSQDGKIAAYGAGDVPDFSVDSFHDGTGYLLAPGFIDIHVHGGAGYEAMDGSPEALQAMARLYAQHGVTSFLATTWTAPSQAISQAMHCIAEQQGKIAGGASLLGAHMEGPYLNPARCGAQDSAQIRRADSAEVLPLLDLGVIRLLALAPEYPENHWLIKECVKRGIAVSAAHTSATFAEMEHAVDLGLTQTTHTYNAMTGLHHREPGTLGAALTLSELRCELIADGVHVHPAAIQVLAACKGKDGIILITDAVRGAGLPVGTSYLQDGREVMIKDAAYLPDGTLAGSTLMFNHGVARFCEAINARIEDIWQSTSLNAARAIGVAQRKGSIELGKDADLVLLDEEAHIQMTIVEGDIVYQRTMSH